MEKSWRSIGYALVLCAPLLLASLPAAADEYARFKADHPFSVAATANESAWLGLGLKMGYEYDRFRFSAGGSYLAGGGALGGSAVSVAVLGRILESRVSPVLGLGGSWLFTTANPPSDLQIRSLFSNDSGFAYHFYVLVTAEGSERLFFDFGLNLRGSQYLGLVPMLFFGANFRL